MRINSKILRIIFALPLVLFSVENAESTKDSTKDSAPQHIDKKSDKSAESKKESKKDSAKDDAKKGADSAKDSAKNPTDSASDDSNKGAESTQIAQSTKEESGWMIGVGFIMGGPIGSADEAKFFEPYNISQKRFDYGAEVILGHKTFFGESGIFGMRLYLDYNYRRTKDSDLTAHFLGLTIDTLFNIYQTEAFKVGVLAGVRSGFGFGLNHQCHKETYVWSDSNEEVCGQGLGDIDWTVDLNVGARLIIYDHNAFEFVLQPRFGVWRFKGKNTMYGIIRYIYTF
ncbi:outer membrane beta-barrel protein [Helicobacter sp. 23-1045]